MVYKLRKDVQLDFSKITQREVANILGISETHLSLVLNRKRKCSKLLALHISKLNGQIDTKEFFEEV